MKNKTGLIMKQRRKELHLSADEVAARLGISRATLYRYENGDIEKLPITILEPLANTLGVSSAYLMGWEDAAAPQEAANLRTGTGIKIPVLGTVAAGIPITAVENIIDYEEIPAAWAAQGDFFGLKIKGDSMSPRIQSGDVIIVRQQSTCDNGDIAVVLINGDEATVKKVQIQESGIMLIPFNHAYEPKFYSNQEIQELPVKIIGKAVELRGKI